MDKKEEEKEHYFWELKAYIEEEEEVVDRTPHTYHLFHKICKLTYAHPSNLILNLVLNLLFDLLLSVECCYV